MTDDKANVESLKTALERLREEIVDEIRALHARGEHGIANDIDGALRRASKADVFDWRCDTCGHLYRCVVCGTRSKP
jgi:rubrerythrin